jgi:tripartite ATP-independent transporter DctM subunit
MPLGFSMLVVGAVGFSIIVSPGAGVSLLGADLFGQFNNYNFTCFPMYIVAGSLAMAAGTGDRIFDATYALFGRLPGSLAVAATAGCAAFAAICGSSTATAAAMGKVALPMMRKYGYDDALAAGSVAAAGTLGPLIPPSTIFIIYGILTQQSIGKLFVAGIFPGLLLTALMIILIVVRCLRNPKLAPRGPDTTMKEKFVALTGLAEVVFLFGFIIVGLSVGWFSPTQAGAVLAVLILFVGLARRGISWAKFLEASRDAVKTTCMIMMLLVGGMIFSRFMAVSNLPYVLAGWLTALRAPPLVIMTIIMAVYFILGFFMDSLATVILTLPIVYPTVIGMGFSPIWFGVLICMIGETAVLVPPLGINVYVIRSIAKDVPIDTIFKGIFPFVPIILLAIAFIMVFPQIALFLPRFLTY